MDTTQTGSNKLHPVMWAAAVAVTLLSVVGIGAITGVIPVAGSNNKPVEPVTATTPAPSIQTSSTSANPAAAAAPPLQPAPGMAQPAAAPAPVAIPKKHVVHAKKPAHVAQTDYGAPPAAERAPARVADTPPAAAPCRDCAVVESVREIKTQGEGTGLGAVAGGVLGGVLGHQIGSGRGNSVATVVGAVGGAVAGHQVEKSARSGSKFEIVVRYEDGSTQVFQQDQAPAWRTGDPVKVVNGAITAR